MHELSIEIIVTVIVLTTSVSADIAIQASPRKYTSGACARRSLIAFSALSTSNEHSMGTNKISPYSERIALSLSIRLPSICAKSTMTSGVIQIRQYGSGEQPIITLQTWRYDGIHDSDISNETVGRLATVKDNRGGECAGKGLRRDPIRRDISIEVDTRGSLEAQNIITLH